MKRRDFVTSVLAAGLAAPAIGASEGKPKIEQDHGGHGGDSGRQGRIVDVSFGHWGRTLPFDRFGAANVNDRNQNVHVILPSPIKAHVGDTIVFHISGLHNPQIYGPGTQPEDINANAVDTGVPAIIDFTRQTAPGVFRGLDPRVLNNGTLTAGGIQDRVEAVSAPTMPGQYLVMCGVKAHFVDATGNFIMVAFMDVQPADN